MDRRVKPGDDSGVWRGSKLDVSRRK